MQKERINKLWHRIIISNCHNHYYAFMFSTNLWCLIRYHVFISNIYLFTFIHWASRNIGENESFRQNTVFGGEKDLDKHLYIKNDS